MKFLLYPIRNERGFTTTFFALMMPIFLAILGLCSDGAILIYNRIALEKATDAAGLATIDAYDRSLWLNNGKVVLREDKAIEYAAEVLKRNMPTARIVSVKVSEERKNECRVETVADFPTIFLKIFGMNSFHIQTFSLSHGT